MNVRAEYDLARSMLLSVYKVRDAMSACRIDLELAKDIDQPALIKIQGQRIKDLSEARRELDAELLEANFLWDFTTVFPVERLNYAGE